jgi:hypothetical protein
MHIFSSVWDAFWLFFWIFAFVAYLMALFSVISDLFRDHELNGWWKAVWILGLFALPFITLLVYLIARGDGMARRNIKAVREQQESAEDYIKTVAGTSSADEIARAKALLDAGTVTSDEYESLKAKALA